ncbi:ABC transporter substrate-binding protein [Streptomyces sp. NBC_01304]|uniref:ABC transporter substrate-binding protein n=1 Tax=Streptomyces sp. NBC_01304 TaxID=2903818 RepID=UPI002E13D701|nr:ABC transporter substrate-binding protein [Streptomyces sp. NBC_01304]
MPRKPAFADLPRRGFLALGAATASLPLIGTADARAAQPTAPAGEPLRVGVLFNLSGRRRVQGARQLLGVRFAAERMRDLTGERVKLVVVDTQGKRAVAREGAREMVQDAGVHVLIGTSAIATSLEVAAVGQAAGVPVVMPSAGSRPKEPYVFGCSSP